MGTITSQTNEEINNKENNEEKKEDLEIKEIKEYSPINNKNKVGCRSNTNILKKDNKKLIQKREKITNFDKRTSTSEKNKIIFNKEIKTSITQSKKRNTLAPDNKIKLNLIKKAPQMKKKTFNKKIEIKNNIINYNNISNNLNKNKYKKNINNENMELLDSNHKIKNVKLKEGIIKTKQKIINIKKELKKRNSDEIKYVLEKKNTIENIRVNNSDIMNNDNNNILKTNFSNLDYELERIKLDELLTNAIDKKEDENIKNENIKDDIYIDDDTSKRQYNIKTELNKEKNKFKKIQKNNTNKRANAIGNFKFNKSKNNEKNEKINNKINEINKKITNRFTPQKRKTYSAYETKFTKMKKNETMDNKHIKNNIPKYRRKRSKSNNYYTNTMNSCAIDRTKSNQNKKMRNIILSNYSFNKNLCNSNIKSNSNKKNNNIYSFRKRTISKNSNSNKDILNKNSIQHSYLNISSIINISANEIINPKNKTNKNMRLLNLINKNIINNIENYNKQNNLDNKENNIDELLFLNFRDAIEIDISLINIQESLIDKCFLNTINDKIIINYNKIDNFKTSQILYDGNIYKIIENKNKGFKMVERYFQIKKNCFRYYNNIESAKIDSDKPLVQFDIRHIKNLNIVDNDIFKQLTIKEKNVEFTFCIFLNQNNDFFVFVINDEKFGNSIFNYLNLLKNYYEDKK